MAHFVYTNSPNHFDDSLFSQPPVPNTIHPPTPIPTVRIAPAMVSEPLNYTHYDFLTDFFKKYYDGKQLDPLVVLHITKIIELSLLHTQDVSGLLIKYKEYFKL